MMNSITRSLKMVAILTKKDRKPCFFVNKTMFSEYIVNIYILTKKIVFDLCFLSKLQLCLSFW